MASFTTTDLLPVPQRPMTCQSSTISTSETGKRNIHGSGLPVPLTMPPSKIHCA